jgi:hypothetical protein
MLQSAFCWNVCLCVSSKDDYDDLFANSTANFATKTIALAASLPQQLMQISYSCIKDSDNQETNWPGKLLCIHWSYQNSIKAFG